MENLILESELLGRLLFVKQTVLLCTPDGQVVGRFIPVCADNEDDQGRPFISEEELHKRESRKEGRTWAAIKADLEKRK